MLRNAKPRRIRYTMCLAALVCAEPAFPHGFVGQLGQDKQATDIVAVVCGASSDHLFLEAVDRGPNPTPRLSVQILKDRTATTTTDRKANDDRYSPAVQLKGDSGIYHVFIDKAGIGPKDYGVTVHCQASGGFHTSTTLGILQDQ